MKIGICGPHYTLLYAYVHNKQTQKCEWTCIFNSEYGTIKSTKTMGAKHWIDAPFAEVNTKQYLKMIKILTKAKL